MSLRFGPDRFVLIVSLFLLVSCVKAVERVKIFTGPDEGTYSDIARDIAKFIALPANIKLDIAPVIGPADALRRLNKEAGWNLAILSADTVHAYSRAAERGNPDAIQLFSPVRLLAPLYDDEIYFIVRRDSEYNAIHDIKNARINLGPAKSASALSVGALYRLLFDQPIAEDKFSVLRHEDALIKLITDQTIDVVAIVADQPAKLLAEMKPEARQYIKLLKFDAAHPSSQNVLKVYSATTIFAASYRNLLSEDLPGLALTNYLVAYRPRLGESEAQLSNLARSWCKNSVHMKSDGHPKWLATRIKEPDLQGKWPYLQVAVFDLTDCDKGLPARLPKTCTQEGRSLGLCD